MNSTQADLPGLIACRYQLKDIVFQGQRSVIYTCNDILDKDNPRILKLIHPQESKAQARSIFLDCARMMKCQHPNLVRLSDFGFDSNLGSVYIVSEYSGKPITPEISTDLKKLMQVVKQICAALDYLHRMKLTISNLDSSHILLSTHSNDLKKIPEVRILNYGDSLSDSISDLARKRNMNFVAPEIIRGDPFDHRIDLYALGVLLYFLMKGSYPYFGTIGQILKQHLEVVVPYTEIDPKIDQIISKLMSKFPESRYETAAEVITEIDSHLSTRMHRPSDRDQPSHIDCPFIGKAREIDDIFQYREQSKSNSGFHIILISGETGIGKERFLRELIAEFHLRNVGVTAVSGSNLDWKKLAEYGRIDSKCIVVHEAVKFEWLQWIRRKFRKSFDEPVFWILTINSDTEDDNQLKQMLYTEMHNVFELRIEPMDSDEINDLSSAYLGLDSVTKELLYYLEQMSYGNPLFVIEALNFLIDTAALEKQIGQWRFYADRIPRQKYPEVICDSLENRYNLLSKEAKSYLEAFILLPKPVVQAEYEQLFDPFEPDLILEIFEKGLFRRQVYNDLAILDLIHPALQMIVSNKMTQDRIAQQHAEIARRMTALKYEPEQIIYHRIRSNERFDLMNEAISAAWRALIHGQFSRIEDWIGYTAENIRASDKVRIQVVRSFLYLLRNRLDDATKCIEATKSNYRLLKMHLFECVALHWVDSYLLFKKGEYSAALKSAKKGLKIARDLDEFSQGAIWIMMIRIYYRMAQPQKTREAISKAKQLAHSVKDPDKESLLCVWLFDLQAGMAMEHGKAETLDLHLKELNKHLFSESNQYQQIIINLRMAEYNTDSGNLIEGKKYANIALEKTNQTSISLFAPELFNLLGTIALREAEYNLAESYFEKAFQQVSLSTQLFEYLKIKRNKGNLFYLKGDLKASRKLFEELNEFSCKNNLLDIELDSINMLAHIALDSARYEDSRIAFSDALDLLKKHRGLAERKCKDKIWFGLGMFYWILNQRSQAKSYLKKAIFYANQSKNTFIQSKCHLVLSQIYRLERNHVSYQKEMKKAEDIIRKSKSANDAVMTRLSQLRTLIDHDLSMPVWNDAIKLWEEVRVQNEIRTKIDVGLVVAKLAVRRNDLENGLKIIDVIIGISAYWGFREFHWRALRLKSQAYESREMYFLAIQALNEANTIINSIVDDFTSEDLKKSYKERPDVVSIKSASVEINEQRIQQYGNPKHVRLNIQDHLRESVSLTNTLSESFRLYRRTMQRVRSSIHQEAIVNIILESVLKLSGSERGALFLMDESHALKPIASKSIGTSWTMDLNELGRSRLFEYVVTSKVFSYTTNILIDDRYNSELITRKIGMRSVLMTPMLVQERLIGMLYIDSRLGNAEYLAMNADMIQELANESALSIENARLYEDLNEVLRSVIRLLASVVDAKDPYTAGHSDRVAVYAVKIGEEMGMKLSDLRELELAALLHDIGKIGVSQEILDNPDVLSEDEKKAIANHPEIGAHILSPIKKFVSIWKAILQHHERIDGSGYPRGLKGEEIDLLARILSVADALDAMTTDRPYRKALTIPEALEQIRKYAGSQFDTAVTSAIERLVEKNELEM